MAIDLNSADFRPLEHSADQLQAIVRPSRSQWREAWSKLLRHRIGMIGLVLVVLITLAAIVGPMIAQQTYSDQNLKESYQKPCWGTVFSYPFGGAAKDEFSTCVSSMKLHPFGTDQHGRDVLVRVLYGARISLAVGFAAAAITLVIGVSYGAISGYLGGWVDDVLMRFVEIVYAIPEVLYVILLLTVLNKSGLTNVFVVLGITGWLRMARVVRGEVLSLKEREFVLAARTIGTKPGAIMFRHLVPNAMGPILVTLTVGIPEAIFLESFLSFIGLGVNAPMASWGSLASDALTGLRSYPYLLFFPAAAIGITLLAFQFLGQGLRDVLDPRIQQ